jgi:hypothetical protein
MLCQYFSQKRYNCIPATLNAGNKASTQRLLTRSCNNELAESKHQSIDSIVNYVKVGGSIVLKFEVFAGGEEQTSTDSITSFTYSIVYPGLS